MMTPEDIVIEAIAAASRFGDSPSLRRLMCHKLRTSLNECAVIYATDAPLEDPDAAPEA